MRRPIFFYQMIKYTMNVCRRYFIARWKMGGRGQDDRGHLISRRRGHFVQLVGYGLESPVIMTFLYKICWKHVRKKWNKKVRIFQGSGLTWIVYLVWVYDIIVSGWKYVQELEYWFGFLRVAIETHSYACDSVWWYSMLSKVSRLKK